MSVLNFPDSPNNGDIYVDPNGRTYVYNSTLTRWELQVNGNELQCVTSIYVGNTPPDSTITCSGSLWWDCDTAELYIYYQEDGVGQSAQWVPVLNLGNITPSLSLEQILDVNYPSAPNNGDLLAYSGGLWEPTSPGAGFLVQFLNLTDTDFTTTPLATNDFVRYDGTDWVNVTISIDDLNNVDITSTPVTANDILKYDGTNFVPEDHVLGNINNVSDTGISSGQILEYNGSNYVPKDFISSLAEANNDGDAAIAGVQLGGLYRLVGQTGIGDIRVRLT